MLADKSKKPTEKGYGSVCKNGQQVNGFKQKEKPGEDADKDIAGLSNTLCALRFDVKSDDVDNDWTEFTRDRRSGENRTVENRVDDL